MSIVVNDTNSNIYKVCVDGEKRNVAKIITFENGIKGTVYNNKYNNLLITKKGSFDAILCNMDAMDIVELENAFVSVNYTDNYYLGITKNAYIYKSFDGITWENMCCINEDIDGFYKWVESANFYIYNNVMFLLLHITHSTNDYYNLYICKDKINFSLVWEKKYSKFDIRSSASTDGEYIYLFATGGTSVTNNDVIYGNRIEIKININTYETIETITHPRVGVGGSASYNNIRCEIDTYKSNLNDVYYGESSSYLTVLQYKNKSVNPSIRQLYECPTIPSMGNAYYSNSLSIKHVNDYFFIFGAYNYSDSLYYPIVYSIDGNIWTQDTNFSYDQYNVLDIFYYRNSYCIKCSWIDDETLFYFFKTNDFVTFEPMNDNIPLISSDKVIDCVAYNDNKIR